MLFNIYIANHGKRDGVEDYLSILRDVLSRRGHEVTVSEQLRPDIVNIVIDEFTNFIYNEEIAAFKRQYPRARLILVLTEFIESRLLVRSFNFFGGPVEAAPVAAMNLYFRLRRKDFLPPSYGDWLIGAIYSPLVPIYYLLHLLKNGFGRKPIPIRRRLYRLAYMLMRYLGLEKMIGCADAVILSHAMIEPGLRRRWPTIRVLGTVFPELDFREIEKTLFAEKELYIEITGSVTPYRQRYVDRIDSNLLALGMKNTFHTCRTISFSGSGGESTSNGVATGQGASSIQQSAARGAYSLHPPQNRQWKYSSPTRIFRALQYDHNMPVLTKLFNQHPIEQLCLLFEGEATLTQMYRYYKDPETLFAYLEPRVQEYMRLAAHANDTIVASLAAVATSEEGNASHPR